MRRPNPITGMTASVPRLDWPALASVVIVAIGVALAVAVPAELSQAADEELKVRIDTAPVERTGLASRTIVPMAVLNRTDPFTATAEELGRRMGELASDETVGFPAPFGTEGDHTALIEMPRYLLREVNGEPPVFPTRLTVRVFDRFDQHATVVATAPPRVVPIPPAPDESGDGDSPEDNTIELAVVEIAVTEETAVELAVQLGDELEVGNDPEDRLIRTAPLLGPQLVLRIAELVELTEPEDPYWWGDDRLHRPLVDDDSVTGAEIFAAAAVRIDTFVRSPWPRRDGGLGVVIERRPLRATEPTVDDAIRWRQELRQAEARTSDIPRLGQTTVATPLGSLLDELAQRRRLADRNFRSLLAIVAVLLTLTLIRLSRYSVMGRRPDLALLRARGGSLTRLTTTALAGGLRLALVAGVLAAILATGFSDAVRNRMATDALPRADLAVAGTILGLAALAVAALTAVRVRRPLAGELDASDERSGPLQRAADVAVVVVAAVAVLSLGTRDPLDGGTDPATVVTVGTLALVAGLLGRRLLRAVGRRRRLRSLTLGLGLRRIGSGSSLGPAMVDVIVLGAVVVAVAVAVHGSIDRAVEEASWAEVGAPVRVDSELGRRLDPVELQSVAGIEAASAESRLRATVSVGGQPAISTTLVLVDAEAAAAISDGDPSRPLGDGLPSELINGRIPVLIPVRGLDGATAFRTPIDGVATLDGLAMTVVGSHRFRGVDGPAVIVDRARYLEAVGTAPAPRSIVLSGSPDLEALAEITNAGAIGRRTDVRRRLLAEPQVATLLAAATLAGALAAAIVAVVSVLTAALIANSRRRQTALFGALGMTSRELVRFVAAEFWLAIGAGLVASLTAVVAIGLAIDRRFTPGRLVLTGADADDLRLALAGPQGLAVVLAVVAAGAVLGWLVVALSLRRASANRPTDLRNEVR